MYENINNRLLYYVESSAELTDTFRHTIIFYKTKKGFSEMRHFLVQRKQFIICLLFL